MLKVDQHGHSYVDSIESFVICGLVLSIWFVLTLVLNSENIL